MYYIIKKQLTQPVTTFIGFQAPKYIASKNSENVIFEFIINGKAQRKWVKKDEIILLTEDKDFFVQTMKRFQEVQNVQQALVDDAKNKLNASIETFAQTMEAHINEFDEIKNANDIPSIALS